MITETVYIAFDGARFDNEWDCRAYEHEEKANSYEGQIFFWDSDKNPIPLSSDIEDVYYVKIITSDAFEWFNEASEDRGYQKIKHEIHNGLFLYEGYEWIRWEDKINELFELGEKLGCKFPWDCM